MEYLFFHAVRQLWPERRSTNAEASDLGEKIDCDDEHVNGMVPRGHDVTLHCLYDN